MEYGSGNGKAELYVVEARTTTDEIVTIAGNTISDKWRHVHFVRATIGVPSFAHHAINDTYAGELFTYEAATALAHWFLTMPKDRGKDVFFIGVHPLCVEARLVRVELTYSYSTKETGVCEPFNHFAMRRAEKFVDREKPTPKPSDAVAGK